MVARDAVTFWLAVYAAVLSTINSAVSFLDYVRDRHRIKISYRRETEVFEEDGITGAGETYTLVTVANKGRRPVTITGVRARLLDGGWVGLHCKPSVPAELSEDQFITAGAGEEELCLDDVAVFVVHRVLGRPYTKAVASWSKRLRCSLKRLR